jgi:hypothetical protein
LITKEVRHLLYDSMLNRKPGPTYKSGEVQSQMRDGSPDIVSADVEGTKVQDDTMRKILVYLTGTKSFCWLTRRIQISMSRSRGNSLHRISGKLLQVCVSENAAPRYTRSPSMSFSVDCDLKAYVKAAFDGCVTLASLICVNANGDLHEASTLGEYMARMWPTTGAQLLELLQEWTEILINEGNVDRVKRKLMIRFTSTYN